MRRRGAAVSGHGITGAGHGRHRDPQEGRRGPVRLQGLGGERHHDPGGQGRPDQGTHHEGVETALQGQGRLVGPQVHRPCRHQEPRVPEPGGRQDVPLPARLRPGQEDRLPCPQGELRGLGPVQRRPQHGQVLQPLRRPDIQGGGRCLRPRSQAQTELRAHLSPRHRMGEQEGLHGEQDGALRRRQ
ncbi:MAG: hypothetical protein BWX71_02765 [Deltaproteobacteria bacterium ADurb.Bin072]|nr:MAG: hypothetical protein BWX71_02765 [Deltaproteobacteria bacterium ADurb.Bin072]